MAMSAGGSKGLENDINVTPMIDVMLVLLIIFMLVVPAIESRVALPVATNPDPSPAEPTDITLIIDRSGSYALQTAAGVEWIPDSRLGSALSGLYQTRTRDRILYLKADTTLGFGIVEHVLDIARGAGVRVVAAVAERRLQRF